MPLYLTLRGLPRRPHPLRVLAQADCLYLAGSLHQDCLVKNLSCSSAGTAPLSYSHFDHSHWLRVKAERARQGLARSTLVGQCVEHALVGRWVLDKDTGAHYLVRSVRKGWSKGWYLEAWLVHEHNATHRTVVVENLSSADSKVVDLLHRYAQTFELSH